LFERLRDALDIIGVMLPVGIGGDYAGRPRERVQGELDAGLQRRAFAPVRGMTQQVNVRNRRRSGEDVAKLRTAPIVDDHHGTALRDGADHLDECRRRPVRRDQNCRLHLRAVTVISMCAAGEASFATPTVVRDGRGSLNTVM